MASNNVMDCSERPATPEIREGGDSPFPSPSRPLVRFAEPDTPTDLHLESLLLQTPEEVIQPPLFLEIPVVEVLDDPVPSTSTTMPSSDILEITIDDDCFSPDVSEVKVPVFDDTGVPFQKRKKRTKPSMQLFSLDEEEKNYYEEPEEEPGFPVEKVLNPFARKPGPRVVSVETLNRPVPLPPKKKLPPKTTPKPQNLFKFPLSSSFNPGTSSRVPMISNVSASITGAVVSRENSDRDSSRSSAAGPPIINFPPPLSIPPPTFSFPYPPPLLPRNSAPRNPPYVVEHNPARSGLRCRKCRSLRHVYEECPKVHGPPLPPDHHLYRGPGKFGSRR